MSKRIIEIGTEGCYLHFKHRQLVIERDKKRLGSVAIEDMSALIIDHPQTLITQACLGKLLDSNVMVISSDEKHLPNGMFLPLQGNTLQAEHFAQQINVKIPIKKNLWKQLIYCKVMLQARLLGDLTGKDMGLKNLAKKIRSGDPDNIEAQAARRYWRQLFGQEEFKRDRFAEDQNRYLNYCYAIVRALVSRSLCATGLHPSIGIHHHNRYNAYYLADDIMEPFRPIADLHVWEHVRQYGAEQAMDRNIREKLLRIIERNIFVDKEMLTLQGAIQRTSQSLSKVFQGEEKRLALPDF